MRRLLLGIALSATALGPAYAQAVRVDPGIPPYARSSGVSGSINSVGSDTINNLMALWGENFQKLYPNVKIQIEGKGSTTAPPALIAGTSQFGPMSRAMKPTEIDQFEKKYGYKPTQIRTSYDALAVWVNKDNPLEKLTLAQVDAIFSKARKRGYKSDLKTWGQLGLTGDWANRPISLYGRNSAPAPTGSSRST
jgi:phosphate transport system substrate-binding protein